MLKPHHRSYYIYFEAQRARLARNKKRDATIRMILIIKGIKRSKEIQGWHFYFKHLKGAFGVHSFHRGEGTFIRQKYEPDFKTLYSRGKVEGRLTGIKKVMKVMQDVKKYEIQQENASELSKEVMNSQTTKNDVLVAFSAWFKK